MSKLSWFWDAVSKTTVIEMCKMWKTMCKAGSNEFYMKKCTFYKKKMLKCKLSSTLLVHWNW